MFMKLIVITDNVFPIILISEINTYIRILNIDSPTERMM